ncbi:branched-chain amino acid ABC transporter permease [Alcaligenaceae bacterium CGII-47]|nr:branched-chain amino acid ABC transporter permease [Alcaligenaceae bacterium CGII-47]
MTNQPTLKHNSAAGLLAIVTLLSTAYMWAFLHTQSQLSVVALLLVAVAAFILGRRFGLIERVEQAAALRPGLARLWTIGGIIILIAALHDSHFALLMICTVLLFTTACLGLTMQFGFTGIANFAGAAFFGIGSYTTAVMASHTSIPHVLIILISGLVAALIGSLLILPVLRTRSHYTALVTIAFGILFKTFLEVNDVLGGPQGLHVPGMSLFGYEFNQGFTLLGSDVSFYVSYTLLSLVICATTYLVIDLIKRSWVGLSMDVVRTDETAAATFGLHIAHWKVVAFVLGNFFAGIAGSIYGMTTEFVAPNNFTFADSLLMVSIVILGGLGNSIGLIPAAIIVLVLPEKLQFIQEYRFFLYAVLVIIILLFRPDGLLPRKTRLFFNRGVSK